VYSLIVDIFLAVLLLITIGYAVILNKRLGTLRRDKAQLEKLSVSFGASTVRAEESIEKLMATADILQDRMESAQGLRDDLAFLIDRGGQAADKLEDLVRESRNRVGVGSHSIQGAGQGPLTDPEPRKADPRPLMADPIDAPGSDTVGPKIEGGELRSEAEQELLKAIRSTG